MLLLLYQKTIPAPSSVCVIKTDSRTPVAEQGTCFDRPLVGSAASFSSLVSRVFIFQENQTVEARNRQPDRIGNCSFLRGTYATRVWWSATRQANPEWVYPQIGKISADYDLTDVHDIASVHALVNT
jgi:hypothetical protein